MFQKEIEELRSKLDLMIALLTQAVAELRDLNDGLREEVEDGAKQNPDQSGSRDEKATGSDQTS